MSASANISATSCSTGRKTSCEEAKETLQHLQDENNVNHPDLADRASTETDRAHRTARP